MNFNMPKMGVYGFVGILSIILGIVKELLIIFLLFRGIQISNIYLRKNKDDRGDTKEENIDSNIDNKN